MFSCLSFNIGLFFSRHVTWMFRILPSNRVSKNSAKDAARCHLATIQTVTTGFKKLIWTFKKRHLDIVCSRESSFVQRETDIENFLKLFGVVYYETTERHGRWVPSSTESRLWMRLNTATVRREEDTHVQFPCELPVVKLSNRKLVGFFCSKRCTLSGCRRSGETELLSKLYMRVFLINWWRRCWDTKVLLTSP